MSSSSVKVIQISSVHFSGDTRIFYRICKSLINAGYDLDLIIQNEKDEVREGVNIIALPVAEKKSDRFYKIIPVLFKKCIAYPKGSIIHFHDPELIPLGFIFKMLGYKVIYDVHEHVPGDVSSKPWIPKLFRFPLSILVGILEKIAVKLFDGIIVMVTDVKERLDSDHTYMIQNFPIIDESKSREISFDPTKNVFYVGDISEVRGAVEMVETAGEIKKKFNIGLTLAGRFSPPELKNKLEELGGWKSVEFVGWISRDELLDYMSECSIGLLLLYPEPHHIKSQPNKLFEYMYGGMPVISANLPRYSEIVNEVNCGILVDPKNTDEVIKAISSLLNNPEEALEMGRRGRQAVIEKYNWQTQESELLSIYKKLTE